MSRRSRLTRAGAGAIIALIMVAIYPRPDRSQDAALFVAPENGLPTIQSAVNAVYSHDMPHTIMLEPGVTYVESVVMADCSKPVTIDGNGAVMTPADGGVIVSIQNCIETVSPIGKNSTP